MFEKLLETARKLHQRLETEWADNHPEAYNEFYEELLTACYQGQITAVQFDALAMLIYDVPDPQTDEEDEEQMRELSNLLDKISVGLKKIGYGGGRPRTNKEKL